MGGSGRGQEGVRRGSEGGHIGEPAPGPGSRSSPLHHACRMGGEEGVVWSRVKTPKGLDTDYRPRIEVYST
eukprot:410995-Prorocentrum_minimum.AAC.1